MPHGRSQPRESVPFSWRVSCPMAVYATLAGVPFDRLFRDADAIVDAYTRGRPMAEALFGPDIAYGGPGWAGISYSHMNTLGAPLHFPEDSEVGAEPIYDSLDAGIAALNGDVDYLAAGEMPFYLDLWRTLQRAFPEREIPFGGCSAEGPITTGWLLRGQDFFVDVMERPGVVREYLDRVTESVVGFKKALQRVNGRPEVAPGAYVADDAAAMLPPRLWPELVLPQYETYYTALSTGTRSAHIEDLRPEHLHFLDDIGLDHYDPSVSPRLTPALVRDHCRVPFTWRLNSMDFNALDEAGIRRWAFEAATDGASNLTLILWRDTCAPCDPAKCRAFIAAANEVERLLADGRPRDALRDRA